MSLRGAIHYLLAGALWGGLAALLGSRAFGDHLWAAVSASPLLGLATGMLMQEPFERLAGWRRGLVALGSLYLGATLFGAVVGLAAAVSTGGTPRIAGMRLVEAVVTVWWGVTLGGFVLFLWPLAYLTHYLLEWRETA